VSTILFRHARDGDSGRILLQRTDVDLQRELEPLDPQTRIQLVSEVVAFEDARAASRSASLHVEQKDGCSEEAQSEDGKAVAKEESPQEVGEELPDVADA